MTPKQRIHLQADLWPRACEAQKWNPNDRARRLDVLGRILGRDIQSANDIKTNEEFDLVKRELGFLADNVTATIESLNPEMGRARRLREKIKEYVQMLGVYHPNPWSYLQVIIHDKFGNIGPIVELHTLTDKPTVRVAENGSLIHGPSQLEQILMAMSRAVHSKRKKAGDSIHIMMLKAKLPCYCLACRMNRAAESTPQQNQADQIQPDEPECVPQEGQPF